MEKGLREVPVAVENAVYNQEASRTPGPSGRLDLPPAPLSKAHLPLASQGHRWTCAGVAGGRESPDSSSPDLRERCLWPPRGRWLWISGEGDHVSTPLASQTLPLSNQC